MAGGTERSLGPGSFFWRAIGIVAIIIGIYAVIYGVASLIVLGSPKPNPQQEAWHQQHWTIYEEIYQDQEELAEPVTSEMLLGRAGPPDFQGSAQELSAKLQTDPQWGAEAATMKRLCDGYQAGRLADTELQRLGWREVPGFLACQIWGYDERVRFTRPSIKQDRVFWGYFYFVEDTVVAATVHLPLGAVE